MLRLCLIAAISCSGAPVWAADEIALSIVTPKATVLVAEPVAIGVTVTTDVPVHVYAPPGYMAAADYLLPNVQIFIDRGKGFEPYTPPPTYIGTIGGVIGGPRKEPLRGGTKTFDVTLVWDKAIGDWVFNRPGRYRVVLEYGDDERTARSNELTFHVQAPSGFEKKAFDALSAFGWYWHHHVAVSAEPLGQRQAAFVDQFPSSVYSHLPRVRDLEARAGKMAENPARAGDRLALLSTALALSGIHTAFTPDAQLLLADFYIASGDFPRASSTLSRIVEQFGGTAVAFRARTRRDVIAAGFNPHTGEKLTSGVR